MLSQTSYPIVGWRLLENDVVPLLPRRVHVAADIDPDESGGVIRWSYLHDPAGAVRRDGMTRPGLRRQRRGQGGGSPGGRGRVNSAPANPLPGHDRWFMARWQFRPDETGNSQ